MTKTHARFRHPSLTAVRAFEAAARLGSFTRAAEELHLTQSAISRHVRALEAWFDLPLFARSGRAVELTQAGREYYRAVADGLSRIGFANDALLLRTRHSQSVNVSLSPSLAVHWLAPRLGRFAGRFPDIEVRLHVSSAVLDTRWEGVDIAIRYGSGGWPGVQAQKLGCETLVPVCAPGLVRARQSRASLSALYELPVLADNVPGGWPKWLRAVGLDPSRIHVRARFNDGAALYASAAAGLGVALGRSRLIEGEVLADRLVTPWRQCVAAPFGYWLVHPNASQPSVAVAAFTQWLREEFALQGGVDQEHSLAGGTRVPEACGSANLADPC